MRSQGIGVGGAGGGDVAAFLGDDAEPPLDGGAPLFSGTRWKFEAPEQSLLATFEIFAGFGGSATEEIKCLIVVGLDCEHRFIDGECFLVFSIAQIKVTQDRGASDEVAFA